MIFCCRIVYVSQLNTEHCLLSTTFLFLFLYVCVYIHLYIRNHFHSLLLFNIFGNIIAFKLLFVCVCRNVMNFVAVSTSCIAAAAADDAIVLLCRYFDFIFYFAYRRTICIHNSVLNEYEGMGAKKKTLVSKEVCGRTIKYWNESSTAEETFHSD